MFTLGARHSGSTSLTTFFFQLFFAFGSAGAVDSQRSKVDGHFEVAPSHLITYTNWTPPISIRINISPATIIGRQKNKEIRNTLD